MRRACRGRGFIDLHEVAEQADPDPDFPTVPFPNPEEPGALDLLLDHAARTRRRRRPGQRPRRRPPGHGGPRPRWATPGAAGWRALTGDELGALLADHLLRRGRLRPRGRLGHDDRVVDHAAAACAEDAGVRYVETLTGFKWIVAGADPGPPADPRLRGGPRLLHRRRRPRQGRHQRRCSSRREMVSDLVDAGRTVLDRLDDLARRHGVHATRQWSVRLRGRRRRGRHRRGHGRAARRRRRCWPGGRSSPSPTWPPRGTGLPPTDAVVLDARRRAGRGAARAAPSPSSSATSRSSCPSPTATTWPAPAPQPTSPDARGRGGPARRPGPRPTAAA